MRNPEIKSPILLWVDACENELSRVAPEKKVDEFRAICRIAAQKFNGDSSLRVSVESRLQLLGEKCVIRNHPEFIRDIVVTELRKSELPKITSEFPNTASEDELDETDKAEHPALVVARRAIASASDKLLALQTEALRLAPLVQRVEIPRGETVAYLIDVMKAYGFFRTNDGRERIEHIIRMGINGQSAGVGYVPPLSRAHEDGTAVPRDAKNRRELKSLGDTLIRPRDEVLSSSSVSPRTTDIAPVIRTAAELQIMTFEPIKYVVPGLIVEGCVLLAGRPKAGKSWLALDIGLAVAAPHDCLGDRKCEQGSVLHLALEDGDRRMKSRITKLLRTSALNWPERFQYATRGRVQTKEALRRSTSGAMTTPMHASS
jgi:AAA domain